MASNGDPLTPRLVDLSLRVIKSKKEKKQSKATTRERSNNNNKSHCNYLLLRKRVESLQKHSGLGFWNMKVKKKFT